MNKKPFIKSLLSLLLFFGVSELRATRNIEDISINLIEESVIQNTVTGTITDDNGAPLAGVNVVEKGTRNGTSTDFDGNYEITVDDNATLDLGMLKKRLQAVQ